jgi:hypothetical protein
MFIPEAEVTTIVLVTAGAKVATVVSIREITLHCVAPP